MQMDILNEIARFVNSTTVYRKGGVKTIRLHKTYKVSIFICLMLSLPK